MERRYEQTGRALKHRFGSMLVSGRRLLQRRVALEERFEGFPKAGGPREEGLARVCADVFPGKNVLIWDRASVRSRAGGQIFPREGIPGRNDGRILTLAPEGEPSRLAAAWLSRNDAVGLGGNG